MPIIPPALVAKLDPLIRRLASTHDGEVVATARAIERRLRAERYDLNDFADTLGKQAPSAPRQESPPPRRAAWRAKRDFCLDHKNQLSARELEFVISLDRWRGQLTPKQSDWLQAIYERVT
jgi:hypothetical protein